MSQLHYLYDQQGTGDQRFVYYCTTCSCVFKVRRDLGPLMAASGHGGKLCASCGMPLEGNVECRLAPIPKEWSDVYQEDVPPA